LGKLLVKIPYISLPNIIAGRKVVPELLQYAVTADNIANETAAILLDSHLHKTILQDLAEVKAKLGEVGAVERVAREILTVAKVQGLSGGQR
jgi:lipid-A-disaccharide synthase